MNKNKYLLLGSSAGVLLLLLLAAIEENFLKDWRRVQGQARGEEGPVNVQLRQVVNPGLGVSDRCTSCHVSMGPGEQGVTGHKILRAHKPVVHDPAEYGCTVCHGGQGQATEKADAHGDVHFWPEPMLPAGSSYAGCGTCHAPLGIPNAATYEKARGAFERLDCLACHRVDDRGGTLRPGGGGMEGPDLSKTGLVAYDTGWYEKHVKKSAEAKSGPWQMSFAAISEADRTLVALYLRTRVAAPKLVEAKAAFHSAGCLGCHKVSGVGGDEGPDLTRAGEKDPGQVSFQHVPGKMSMANWFAEHFRSPAAVVAASQMPPVNLGEEELERLTFYVLSLRRRDVRGQFLPKDRLRATNLGEREFTTDGATIFGAFCSGCHGLSGEGRRAPGMAAFPSIGNADFLSLAGDDFLMETVKRGRPGRRMPPWGEKEGGLRPDELRAVVAWLRESSGVPARTDTKPVRWVNGDAAEGRILFSKACAGCHGAKGEGGEGPALNNKVLLGAATDTYLVETISRGRRGTAMEGFNGASPVRPALSSGEIQSIVVFIRSWQGGKS
jgi:cytochrome c oxidase cbb3-type subunit 3